MRFVMKERLLSWGDDFYIKDENDRDVFFVDGKALSFGDQLSFQDLQGNEPERIHFAEYLTGLLVADKKNLTGID
jgi:uncharacterized protein YxjI